MITFVRFKSPVTIGSEETEWRLADPRTSAWAGKITPRLGNPDNGEFRDSIVFEVRIGKPEAHHDVEVPRANIAHITRTAPIPKQEGKKP